jgi:hypothetical protein
MSNIVISPESGILEFNYNNPSGSAINLDTASIRLHGNGGNSFITGGNVGIGITNPTSPLSLKTTAVGQDGSAVTAMTKTIATTNIGAKFSFSNGSNTSNNIIGGLSLGNEGEEFAGMYAVDGGASASTHLALFVGTSAGTIEGMRILSDGNVGIGTNNTDANLEVKQVANDAFVKVSTEGAGAWFQTDSTNQQFQGFKVGHNWFMGQYASNDFVIKNGLQSNGTTVLAIQDTTNNVGIGTNSPTATLEVTGDIFINGGPAGGRSLALKRTGATNPWKLVQGHTQTDYLEILEGSDTRFLIKNGGNVGIGITNPTTKLDVSGSVSNSLAAFRHGSDGVEFTTRTSNGRQQIDFLGSNTSSINAKGSLFINYDTNNDGSNDSIIFARNNDDEDGTLDMIIKEGKVAIGTDAPDSMLDVHSGSNTDLLGSLRNDNVNRMNFKAGMGSTIRYVGTVPTFGNGDGMGFTLRLYDGAEKVWRCVRVVVKNDSGTNSVSATIQGGGEDTDIHVNLEHKNRDGDATKTDFFLNPTASKSFTQFFDVEGFIVRETGHNTTSLTSISLDDKIGINVLDSSHDSRVGIGATTVNAGIGLQVANGGIYATNGQGFLHSINAQYFANGQSLSLIAGQSADLKLMHHNTVDVTVKSDGNVGIGTNNPSDFHSNASRLVVGDGAGAEGITIFSQDNNAGYLYFADGTAGDAAYRGFLQYSHSTNNLSLGAAGGTKLTIASDGDVDVVGDVTAARFLQDGASASQFYAVQLTRSSSSLTSPDVWDANGHGLVLGGAVSEGSLVVKAGGNVGIGTDDPATSLHVFNSAGPTITFERNNNSKLDFTFGTANTSIIGAGELQFRANGGTSNKFVINNGLITASADLYVNADVGIGTNNAAQKLHLEFANTDTSFSGGSGGDWGSEGLLIENTSSTTDTMAMIQLRNGDADFHIAGIRQGTNDNDLGFFAEGSEKVRITKDGNVGIGLTEPSHLLSVGTIGNANGKKITTYLGGSNEDYSAIGGQRGQANAFCSSEIRFINEDNSAGKGAIAIAAGTNSLSEHLRVTSAGNVGIGTSNPDNALDVFGDGKDIYLRSNDHDVIRLISVSSDVDEGLFSVFHDGTEEVRLRGAGPSWIKGGNVGIGTDSPNALLHVYSAGNGEIEVQRSGGSLINLQAQATKGVIGTDSNHQLDLKTNGGARMSLLTNGQVGIGTTEPSDKLHVWGAVRGDLKLEGSFQGGSTDVGKFTYAYAPRGGDHNNRTIASVSAYNTTTDSTAGGYLSITTRATNSTQQERIRVNQDGQVDIYGNASFASYLYHKGDEDTNFKFNTDEIIFNVGGSAFLRLTEDGSQDIATFNPDAEDIDFKVRASSSTDAIFVRGSDGEVGINTTNPTAAFHVLGNARIKGASSDGSLTVENNAASQALVIDQNSIRTSTNNNLTLYSNGTNTQLVLENGGNVGIGTNDPARNLSVASSSANVVMQLANSTTTYAADNGLEIFVSDNDAGIVNRENGYLRFDTNNTERVRILANGNVGIGTDAAAQKLTVKGGVSATNSANIPVATLTNSSDDGRLVLNQAAGVTKVLLDTDGVSYFKGGNVGIGTDNPTENFSIENTGGICGMNLKSASNNLCFIDFGDSDDGNIGGINYNNSDDTLNLRAGNANRLTVNSSGKVGIGTTNPQEVLDVVGLIRFANTRSDNTQKIARLLVPEYNNSHGQFLSFMGTANETSNAVSYGGGTSSADAATVLLFYTASSVNTTVGTERMRIASDGNVGIGTNDPGDKLEVNGSFSASSKTFNIEHPTQSGKRLIHGCFEGPEHGVYFRGKSQDSLIEPPEYWSGLVDIESMTVDVTPIGPNQSIYVDRIDDNGNVYVGANTNEPLNYFYVIYGERKDLDKLEVVKDILPSTVETNIVP